MSLNTSVLLFVACVSFEKQFRAGKGFCIIPVAHHLTHQLTGHKQTVTPCDACNGFLQTSYDLHRPDSRPTIHLTWTRRYYFAFSPECSRELTIIFLLYLINSENVCLAHLVGYPLIAHYTRLCEEVLVDV